MSRIIDRLQKHDGFWFPAAIWSIDHLYRWISLCYRLNAYLDRRKLGGPWVSELYQALGAVIGVAWIALIEWPVFTGWVWIRLGILVVGYRILEMLLFSLHWLLVAEGPVKSVRRSLLGFLLNLLEVGIFFTIAYLLLGWFNPPRGAWEALRSGICTVFSVGKPSGLIDAYWPQTIARVQQVISWVLVVLIIGNVVGAIDRKSGPQEHDKDSDSAHE